MPAHCGTSQRSREGLLGKSKAIKGYERSQNRAKTRARGKGWVSQAILQVIVLVFVGVLIAFIGNNE